jgi:hypothetical protein
MPIPRKMSIHKRDRCVAPGAPSEKGQPRRTRRASSRLATQTNGEEPGGREGGLVPPMGTQSKIARHTL